MNVVDENLDLGSSVYYAVRINLSGYSPDSSQDIYCGNVRITCLRVL